MALQAVSPFSLENVCVVGDDDGHRAVNIGDTEVEELHFAMLKDIRSLLDPQASAVSKWEIWCWMHEYPQPKIRWSDRAIEQPRERPFTFSQACALQGCDPEEVVLLIHDLLERSGVSIQRPASCAVRISARKAQMLNRLGVSVEDRPEMHQQIGRIRRETPQMDLFAAFSLEDVHE